MKTLIATLLTTLTLAASAVDFKPATSELRSAPRKQTANTCWPYEHVKDSVRLRIIDPSVPGVMMETNCSKAEAAKYIERMVKDGTVVRGESGRRVNER